MNYCSKYPSSLPPCPPLPPPPPPLYRCLTCGNYVYKGKKFNARKEDAKGEKYLGIQIYRFYIRCPQCLSEITFKVGSSGHYTVQDTLLLS